MGLLGCCSKCCLCAVFGPCIWLFFITIALIAATYLSYEFYLKPWGEDLLAKAPTPAFPGAACDDCTGTNDIWPTQTTGLKKFLDSAAAKTASGIVSASVAAGVSSSVFALVTSSIVTTAIGSSVSCGFMELFHIIGQAQFAVLLGSLQTEGAPRFLYEFSGQLAWTNLHFKKGSLPDSIGGATKRLLMGEEADDGQQNRTNIAKGVQRYANYIGVEPDYLFYYALLVLLIVSGVIIVAFIVLILILRAVKKDNSDETTRKLTHRLTWAFIQLFLLIQYGFSMTATYQIYYSINNDGESAGLILAIITLLFCAGGLVIFGIYIISKHSYEFHDLGTDAHEGKPFHSKYGPYYEDFNKENRYFFVAKVGLDIVSGVIVGAVQNANIQIGILIGLNLTYLIFLVIREPFLIRLFFYVGSAATFFRLILLLLTLALAQGDTFPQKFRNNIAYAIILINVIIFFCLIVRQIYVMINFIIKWYKNRKAEKADFSSLPLASTNSNTNDHSSNIELPHSAYMNMKSTSPHDESDTRNNSDYYNLKPSNNSKGNTEKYVEPVYADDTSSYSNKKKSKKPLKKQPLDGEEYII